MTPDLTLTETVLTWVLGAEPDAPADDPPLFGSDEASAVGILTMERAAWEDMGRPEQITVSIEPGDRLNKGGVVHEFVPAGDGKPCGQCGFSRSDLRHG